MNNIAHIIVESEKGYYQFLKTNVIKFDRKWYTTSPWLLEKLPSLGEEVNSLEDNISNEQIVALGDFYRCFFNRICKKLVRFDDVFPFELHLGSVLKSWMTRAVFPLLYKHFLLNQWMDQCIGFSGKGYIVGSDQNLQKQIYFGRFDTLYYLLAKHMGLPENVELLNCDFDQPLERSKEISELGTSHYERLFSVLNWGVEVVFFKIWKRFLGSRNVSLPLINQSRLSITYFNDCELTEETALHFLLRGCLLSRLKLSKGGIFDGIDEHACLQEHEIIDALDDTLQFFPNLSQYLWERSESLARLISLMMKNVISYCYQCANDMMKIRLDKPESKKGVLVTNGLYSPFERLVYYWARKHNMPVYVAEHGLTNGLSNMSGYSLEDNELCASSAALCFSEESSRFHKMSCGLESKVFTVGMPQVNRKLKYRRAQRYLSMRRFGLPAHRRVVVYISNLYFNNYVYSPGSFGDTYYHRIKRKMVYEVLGKINDTCLLKLYPTHRYVDPDPFAGLMVLPNNVRVIQFFEYRYLRAVGDVVICDSPQSTLGWVWSTRAPLVFLDLPSNPLLPPVADAFDHAVFRIDCSRDGWWNEARELLLLPPQELVRRWNRKREQREEIEERFIFGPGGRAGKRAADLIIRDSMDGTLLEASGLS